MKKWEKIMNKIINTKQTIHDIVDIDILNDFVDKAVGESCYDIDYEDISLNENGEIILNVSYEVEEDE